jgi:CheY-like chemotaxis protein
MSEMVLVVDDDPLIVASVVDLLDLEGYRTEVASNGAEALELLEGIKPCVVLLDMRMPVMDGWHFAAELRNRGIRVPVLVMTAAQSARTWAEEIGADGYVPKPFKVDELLSSVERLCCGAHP